MSFKNKKGKKPINKSLLAMTKAERASYMTKSRQKRKKGTTILIKNSIISQFNVNEIKLIKDEKIEAIELSTEKDKMMIIGMHAEPNRTKKKKKNFYAKLKNIIMNNIPPENKIIIGGDANSIWDDEDTSNKDKNEIDKTIKEFCKELDIIDLTREYRLNNNIINKGDKFHT
jgi:exonuclease III